MTLHVGRRQLLGMTALAGLSLAAPRIAGAATSPGSLVNTRSGPVRGASADGVFAFKGIPYAAPPVGELRFAPPRPVAPWTAPAPAETFGHTAMQMPSPSATNPTSELGKALQAVFPSRDDLANQSEDCLVLNVWSKTPGKGKRPVMVWLHGGGFAYGSAAWPMYDGSNLARDHDVVVVSVNHRLNVFGYLHLPQVAGSGNAGMLDIVAALEWVRDNIALFGGDPGNVTIFGESGGGAKVSYLLAMPAAHGLFHRAIIQSGPAITDCP